MQLCTEVRGPPYSVFGEEIRERYPFYIPILNSKCPFKLGQDVSFVLKFPLIFIQPCEYFECIFKVEILVPFCKNLNEEHIHCLCGTHGRFQKTILVMPHVHLCTQPINRGRMIHLCELLENFCIILFWEDIVFLEIYNFLSYFLDISFVFLRAKHALSDHFSNHDWLTSFFLRGGRSYRRDPW